MLHELKHGQDPISKVQVLDKGLLVRGDQTLQSAGLLLQPKRKRLSFTPETKLEQQQTIHAESLLQVNIPCSLREIGAGRVL